MGKNWPGLGKDELGLLCLDLGDVISGDGMLPSRQDGARSPRKKPSGKTVVDHFLNQESLTFGYGHRGRQTSNRAPSSNVLFLYLYIVSDSHESIKTQP
jgi:hypothetical protein